MANDKIHKDNSDRLIGKAFRRASKERFVEIITGAGLVFLDLHNVVALDYDQSKAENTLSIAVGHMVVTISELDLSSPEALGKLYGDLMEALKEYRKE